LLVLLLLLLLLLLLTAFAKCIVLTSSVCRPQLPAAPLYYQTCQLLLLLLLLLLTSSVCRPQLPATPLCHQTRQLAGAACLAAAGEWPHLRSAIRKVTDAPGKHNRYNTVLRYSSCQYVSWCCCRLACQAADVAAVAAGSRTCIFSCCKCFIA
jgi:hypothetical protein